MSVNSVAVGPLSIGGDSHFLWILGPCVIESRDFTLKLACDIQQLAQRKSMQVVFKASFDKANRTSGSSFRGVGIDAGLRILGEVQRETGMPVTTDIHEVSQVAAVAEVCEVLQIPAFLARQTDLIVAAAKTGKVVNVKKGQFMAPWDMHNVVKKVRDAGNERVLLTERGTTFGYGLLVNDMRAIPWMQESSAPVIFDATHSVQTPGGLGDRTGGDRRMVPHLMRAAIAAGCNGGFIETHPDPNNAPSDGPNMVPFHELDRLLDSAMRIRDALIDI